MQKKKTEMWLDFKQSRWFKEAGIFWAETSKFWHHSNNVPNPKNIPKNKRGQ